MSETTKLGQMLVEANLITDRQLNLSLDFQRSVGGRLGAIIVKLGFIAEETLMNFISRQQGIPLLNIDELVVPENLVKKVPKKLIEKHQILPVGFKNNVLSIAMSDPYDFEALEEIQLAVDYKVEVNLASRSAIERALREIFKHDDIPPPETAEKTKDDILKELENNDGKIREPSDRDLRDALIPLLVEKGVITEEELRRKAAELNRRT